MTIPTESVTKALKKFVEGLIGMGKPDAKQIQIRSRKPRAIRLKDDGATPNNPRCPLLVYRSPIELDSRFDPAAIFEAVFAKNRWKDSWRAQMYGFNHFHSGTHECLGVARGKLVARFGGAKGRKVELKAGDVVIIPAGVGHNHIRQSKDLPIVGAYPANSGKYDDARPEEMDHKRALARIRKVRRPSTDPVYGSDGPLLAHWPIPKKPRA